MSESSWAAVERSTAELGAPATHVIVSWRHPHPRVGASPNATVPTSPRSAPAPIPNSTMRIACTRSSAVGLFFGVKDTKVTLGGVVARCSCSARNRVSVRVSLAVLGWVRCRRCLLRRAPYIAQVVQLDAEQSGCRCDVLTWNRVRGHYVYKLACEGRHDRCEQPGQRHGYPTNPDRLGVEQTCELLCGHGFGSSELERSGRRFGVERSMKDRFHDIDSVQRSEPLGPAAEQRYSAGLRDERRCGRARLAGRTINVITTEDDRWNSTRAQRLFRFGLVAQIRVRRVKPRGVKKLRKTTRSAPERASAAAVASAVSRFATR